MSSVALNNVDFNRLRIFYYVCKQQSIRKAAEALHITRSAVSQHIKKLEEELKVQLFDRSTRTLILTQAAERLVPLIENFVLQLEATLGHWDKAREEPLGTLRVGAPLVFGGTLLIEAMHRFRKKYSQVTFELSLKNEPWELSREVQSGTLDLAIVDLYDVIERQLPLVFRQLIIEEQVLVASPRLLRALELDGTDYITLSTAPMIPYVSGGPDLKLWFKAQFGKFPPELNIVFSSHSVQAITNAVRKDMGLGLIPAYLIRKELKSGQLIAIKTKKPYLNRIGIVQSPNRKPGLAEKKFVVFFEQKMKELGEYL